MNFNFGFSYVGLFFIMMLIIPNIIWSKNIPIDYEKYAVKENKILLLFEKIGQILVTCFALIFSDFNIQHFNYWTILLLISFLIMLLYEFYWIRYFNSNRTMKDFYSSVLGIPLAGATLPVLAFLLLAIYGRNILMFIAIIIFGIGHICIHFGHFKDIKKLN